MNPSRELIDQVVQQWERLLHNLEQDHTRHMMSLVNEVTKTESVAKYQLSELHVLDLIGQTENPHVTEIAEQLHLTRGAISKITKKLIARGDITSFQRTGNQKNIYFQLTPKGGEIYQWHLNAHHKARQHVSVFFSKYSPEQLSTIQVFLSEVARHMDLLH